MIVLIRYIIQRGNKACVEIFRQIKPAIIFMFESATGIAPGTPFTNMV